MSTKKNRPKLSVKIQTHQPSPDINRNYEPDSDDSSGTGGPYTGPTQIYDIIGEMGKWQWIVCLFHSLFGFFSAFHVLGRTFYAPSGLEHWCIDPNTTDPIYLNGTRQICDCIQWEHDKEFDKTIISEWDLVCDKSWLPSLTQSIYMAGEMSSSLIMSQVSDRIGRVKTLKIGLVMELIAGFSSAAAPNIIVFSVSRYFLAFGGYTRQLTASILMVECIGTADWRSFWSQMSYMGWVAGYITLPGVAYLLRNFRYIQLFVSTVQLALAAFFVLWLPESPRWLLLNGHWERARAMSRRAIRLNFYSEPSQVRQEKEALLDRFLDHQKVLRSIETERHKMENTEPEKGGIMDLFSPKARHLRRTLLIMYYTWLVNGFVYYGLSLNTDQLFESSTMGIFWGFFAMGLVEAPCYVANAVALRYIGRRPFTIFLMISAGLACLATIFLNGSAAIETARVVVALSGKFFISCSHALIYLVATEVFPTIFRHTALGTCSAALQVGAILAPFVKELSESTAAWVALATFSLLAITDGFAVFFIPETRGEPLSDTIAEAEKIEIKDDIRRKESMAQRRKSIANVVSAMSSMRRNTTF